MSITLTVEVAKKYLSNTFVETGTNHGGGVKVALDAGFSLIYSVEIDSSLYLKSKERFASNENVFLFHGDSKGILPVMLKKVRGKATFWLDAHPSHGPGNPLLQELEYIEQHPCKRHTIMIDDRKYLKGNWGINEAEVVAIIRRINPHYRITYEDSKLQKQDIIVATVPTPIFIGGFSSSPVF